MPGKLIVVIEWIELVVLVGKIEKPKREVTEVAPKAVADISIQLKDIIPGFVGEVSDIALPGPVAFDTAGETGRMVVERENLTLMKRRFLAAIPIDHSDKLGVRLSDILKDCLQIREGDLISRAE